MKLTTEQMRELDAWIAENLFSWKWGHFGFVKRGLPELPIEPIFLLPPDRFGNTYGCGNANPFPKEQVESWKHFGSRSLIPNYTTDPAAAMMVMEACYQKDRNSYFASFHNFLMRKEHDASFTPLQICLFARKLFNPHK